MTKASIERRLAALEADANPTISTWADLVIAVDEGREIVLAPAMQGVVDTALPGSAL